MNRKHINFLIIVLISIILGLFIFIEVDRSEYNTIRKNVISELVTKNVDITEQLVDKKTLELRKKQLEDYLRAYKLRNYISSITSKQKQMLLSGLETNKLNGSETANFEIENIKKGYNVITYTNEKIFGLVSLKQLEFNKSYFTIIVCSVLLLLLIIYRVSLQINKAKINLVIVILLALSSCKENKSIENPAELFEDSFKTQKNKGIVEAKVEQIDSTKNIYSNYKYNVAYDSPDHWVMDYGVSDHTILRTFDKDSAIGIAINVIETKFNPNMNIWEIYNENPESLENMFRESIEASINGEMKDYKIEKGYIKNVQSLKRTFTHTVRDSGFEYDNVNIIQQAVRGSFYYTFTLFVPEMFYDENPTYYDSLYLNLYFLIDKEKMKSITNPK